MFSVAELHPRATLHEALALVPGLLRFPGVFSEVCMKLSVHFARREFACACGCGFDTIDAATLEILESVREHFGRPVIVTSGARCREHNASVGGASNSQHLVGRAADIKVQDHSPVAVADFIEENYPHASIGRYLTFTHVDTRTEGPAYWGQDG